ncbi:MAG: twin-arginine translocase subunit TatC [Planctomycetota bacterium]
MLRRKTDEDLFRDSTMTFGEHLEELRSCLFKAVVGLVLGTIVGLIIGDRVVDFIQTPLRNALIRYYERQTATRVADRIQELKAAGYSLPEDTSLLADVIAEQGLFFEEVFINPAELTRRLEGGPTATLKPEDAVQLAVSPSKGHGLVPLFIWRRLADDPRVRLTSLRAEETFMIYVKASILVGAIIASPWIFYQLWSFVASGLYRHERKYIYIFLPFSLILFFAGVAMAFGLVFQPVLDFLFGFNAQMGIDPDPRISEWLGFVLFLPLGFGISFQLPLVMLFLERVGIFDVPMYLSYWRVSVLVICVLAMVLTPSGDPYSMMLMAGPLVVLYFGGVGLCRFMPKSKFSRFDMPD